MLSHHWLTSLGTAELLPDKHHQSIFAAHDARCTFLLGGNAIVTTSVITIAPALSQGSLFSLSL